MPHPFRGDSLVFSQILLYNVVTGEFTHFSDCRACLQLAKLSDVALDYIFQLTTKVSKWRNPAGANPKTHFIVRSAAKASMKSANSLQGQPYSFVMNA